MSKTKNISEQILQICPKYLTIPNFTTERTYKYKISLNNITSYFMIFNLRSSDKERMKLSENEIKLKGGQTKHIQIMIRDNIKYFNNKCPRQRRIFLIIKSDLFEERYPIDLLYESFQHKEIYIQNTNTIKQQDEIIEYNKSKNITQESNYQNKPDEKIKEQQILIQNDNEKKNDSDNEVKKNKNRRENDSDNEVGKENKNEKEGNAIIPINNSNNDISYSDVLMINTASQIECLAVKEKSKISQEEKNEMIIQLTQEKNNLLTYVNSTLKQKWSEIEIILNKYDKKLSYQNSIQSTSPNNKPSSPKKLYPLIQNSFSLNTINPFLKNQDIPKAPSLQSEYLTLKSQNNLLLTENNLLKQRLTLLENKLSFLANP